MLNTETKNARDNCGLRFDWYKCPDGKDGQKIMRLKKGSRAVQMRANRITLQLDKLVQDLYAKQ